MDTWAICVKCLIETLDSVPFIIFLIMVLSDVVTGFAKAVITGKPSSSDGVKGITKHLMEVFGVLVIATTFAMLDQQAYGTIVIMAMYAVEGISLVGNLDAMGVPLPSWLVDYFGDIKDKQPKDGD